MTFSSSAGIQLTFYCNLPTTNYIRMNHSFTLCLMLIEEMVNIVSTDSRDSSTALGTKSCCIFVCFSA